MTNINQPKVLLTSPVFYEIAQHSKVSLKKRQIIDKKWEELKNLTDVVVSRSRFPTSQEIEALVKENNINHILCHLSHPISKKTLEIPSVVSVSTSTAGFNHVEQVPNVLITHTPSVLDKTVADFTLAAILGSLRNLIDLHVGVWDGKWSADQKWDLDENLNNTLDNLTIGIIGLGEIGRELVRKIGHWGVKIQYYDLIQNQEMEAKFSNLSFTSELESIFATADIVSLHVPLNTHTRGLVGEKLLKLMKPNSLLVNTARGPVVNFPDLIRLLKNKEISINLAFDVFDPEPLTQKHLTSFKEIKHDRPNLRFLFMPHNASSDADTRAQMAIIVLEDLISLVKSTGLASLKSLRLIPSQKYLKQMTEQAEQDIKNYRISKLW